MSQPGRWKMTCFKTHSVTHVIVTVVQIHEAVVDYCFIETILSFFVEFSMRENIGMLLFSMEQSYIS